MLFGKKPEAERVRIDMLKDFINAAFDAKLESFAHSAEAARRSVLKSEEAFVVACERFGSLDAEPDFEGMLPVNVTYLKSRKAAYSDALKQHVLSSRRAHERHTKYHSYLEALTQAEEAIASINSTNNIFKQVFLAYAANLNELKRAFADLERSAKQLGAHISNVKGHADDYAQIMVKIDTVISLLAELGAIDALEAELSAGGHGKPTSSHSEADRLLDTKMAELAEAKKRVVAEASALKNLMMPLGRIARKYDHGLGAHTRRLSDMVVRPETELVEDKDYNEFMERLRDLLKSIGNGSIDINADEAVVNTINGILSEDIRAYVTAYKSAASDRAEIERQVSELRREADKAEAERMSAEKRAQELESVKNRRDAVNSEIRSHCSSIEAMVLKSYRRSIKINTSQNPGQA